MTYGSVLVDIGNTVNIELVESFIAAKVYLVFFLMTKERTKWETRLYDI